MPTIFADSREISAKMLKSKNFKTVEDRQIMLIEHGYELEVTLPESVIENYVRRPSGNFTITKFTVCKNTLVSRNRCMTEVKSLLNTNRKLRSRIQNPLLEPICSAPYRRYHDDVVSGLQGNVTMSETVLERRKQSMEH